MKNFTHFLTLLCTSFFLFLWNDLFAQPPVAKFGDVTLNELKFVPDVKDTTAEAIILFDIGHFFGNQISFTRHLRIKILKSSGTQWGNWLINTPSKSNIKAVVFNLENGLLTKEKLEKSEVPFQERNLYR
jgi:hypothetical protein